MLFRIDVTLTMANAPSNDPYLIILIPSESFPVECGQVPGDCSQRGNYKKNGGLQLLALSYKRL